jgi:hypothetical protein
MIGLGGSLDVFAGVTKRAPPAWRKLGLEWLYRLCREPRRIGRMMKLPRFLILAVAEGRKKTMQSEASMDKARLRSIVREQIRLLDDDYVIQSNRRIFEAVCRLPEYRRADRIFLYCSVEREIDTAAIRAHAENEGKLVAFPRVYGGGRMDFAAVDGLPAQFFGIPRRPPNCRRLLPAREISCWCRPCVTTRTGTGSGRAAGITTVIWQTAPP